MNRFAPIGDLFDKACRSSEFPLPRPQVSYSGSSVRGLSEVRITTSLKTAGRLAHRRAFGADRDRRRNQTQ